MININIVQNLAKHLYRNKGELLPILTALKQKSYQGLEGQLGFPDKKLEWYQFSLTLGENIWENKIKLLEIITSAPCMTDKVIQKKKEEKNQENHLYYEKKENVQFACSKNYCDLSRSPLVLVKWDCLHELCLTEACWTSTPSLSKTR